MKCPSTYASYTYWYRVLQTVICHCDFTVMSLQAGHYCTEMLLPIPGSLLHVLNNMLDCCLLSRFHGSRHGKKISQQQQFPFIKKTRKHWLSLESQKLILELDLSTLIAIPRSSHTNVGKQWCHFFHQAGNFRKAGNSSQFAFSRIWLQISRPGRRLPATRFRFRQFLPGAGGSRSFLKSERYG